jgi:hypothetical protein
MRMTRSFRTLAGLTGAALALTLGACKLDNRPLLARGEPLADAGAPAPGPLDPGYAPVVLQPAQAYGYPERAARVSRIAYARPPSYGFNYGDEQPWAWDVADEGLMFAEPYDAGWRYYYYEPGEASPYYVQDADYGYAYGDDGALIALFSLAGALIAADRYDDYAPRAGYYRTRGYDLGRSYRAAPRYPVEDTVWRRRAPAVFAVQDRWFKAYEGRPAWREAARHDNGLHLGWYKARPDKDGGRRIAAAPYAEARADRVWGGGRPDHRPNTARVEREGHGREDRSGQPWRKARQDPGPAQDHGPSARDAGARGRDAASRAPEHPQADHGRAGGNGHGGGKVQGSEGGKGHGGGAQGGGGGGHGQGGGGDHGGKGGGHKDGGGGKH